jgi:hypothetical protein
MDERGEQMSMRILAVLATRVDATIGDVLDVVARDEDERTLAAMALGGLIARRSVMFANEEGYTRRVPLAELRVRLVPL